MNIYIWIFKKEIIYIKITELKFDSFFSWKDCVREKERERKCSFYIFLEKSTRIDAINKNDR